MKEPGRKKNSPNKKSGYLKNCTIHYRTTEGYMHTLEALGRQFPTKSKSDILHEALQIFGLKNLNNTDDIYWLNRIL